MPTQCNTKPLEFEPHGRRRVVADFDGGPITSDAGALLLRRVDRLLALSDQVAACFTDRTSTHTFQANQLRLLMTSFAYVLVEALCRWALRSTCLARATVGSIRLKLLKIGAQVTTSVRRIKVSMASGCPYQREFRIASTLLPP